MKFLLNYHYKIWMPGFFFFGVFSVTYGQNSSNTSYALPDSLYKVIRTFIDRDTAQCYIQAQMIIHNRGNNIIEKYNNTDTSFKYLKMFYDSFPHESYYRDQELWDVFYNKHWPKSNPKGFALLSQMKDSLEKTYNKPIQQLLSTMYQDAEKERFQVEKLRANPRASENALKKAIGNMNQNDEKRFKQLDSIFKVQAYPGKTLVGVKIAPYALWILQNASFDRQISHLNLITDAVTSRELGKSSLALFIDRLMVGSGRKQIFGSQYQIIQDKIMIYPIEDFERIDIRRRQYGLLNHEDYIEGIRKSHEEDLMKRKMAKE